MSDTEDLIERIQSFDEYSQDDDGAEVIRLVKQMIRKKDEEKRQKAVLKRATERVQFEELKDDDAAAGAADAMSSSNIPVPVLRSGISALGVKKAKKRKKKKKKKKKRAPEERLILAFVSADQGGVDLYIPSTSKRMRASAPGTVETAILRAAPDTSRFLVMAHGSPRFLDKRIAVVPYDTLAGKMRALLGTSNPAVRDTLRILESQNMPRQPSNMYALLRDVFPDDSNRGSDVVSMEEFLNTL